MRDKLESHSVEPVVWVAHIKAATLNETLGLWLIEADLGVPRNAAPLTKFCLSRDLERFAEQVRCSF